MGIYENMLPKEKIEGHCGYYPVCSTEEWDNLPNIYKAMEWFPVQVYNCEHKARETTIPEYVVFYTPYMMPYGIRAHIKVHVQEVQSILFCHLDHPECQLYTVSDVIFANGVKWGAEWKQDCTTGAFAIYASGKCIGMQGGYLGHIPSNIEVTDDGEFKWNLQKGLDSKNRCHYALLNPFTHR